MSGADWLEQCSRKTNEELFAGLCDLDGREALMLAQILAHLATLDERKAAEELAYPSLFVYCTRKLGYSEAEAYLRIRAARAGRRYPRILTMIARGGIHVTAVARIAPHLTPENYRSVLRKAGRRTQEELDRLIAELAPQAEKRPVIRALSTGSNAPLPAVPKDSLFAAPASSTPPASGSPAEACSVPTDDSAGPESRSAGAASPRAPAGRVLFNFVADEAFRAKFKRARELMWHRYPRGLPEEIFDAALEALLDRKDPWRLMARKELRKRTAEAAKNSSGRYAQA